MKKWLKYVLPLFNLAILVYYFDRMGWDIAEFTYFGLGIIALWAPLGALFYILLRMQVPDRPSTSRAARWSTPAIRCRPEPTSPINVTAPRGEELSSRVSIGL